MPVLVRIPTPLRRHTGGAGDVYAKGKDVGANWRDPHQVAKALIELIAQEVKAYQRKPTS